MMSVECIPKLIWSRYGPSILMVTNITDDKEYELITPSEYINMQNIRGFDKFKGRYAILYPDGKLSIPDSTTKIVNVLLYSLEENLDDISKCDGDDSVNCKSYWDTEFNVPTKIREVAIQETLKEVAMRIQIPKDESPDHDSNVKTKNPN